MPPKKNTNDENGEEVEVHISFQDLERSMTIFTGDDTYPISEFFDEFEDAADLMKWTKVERLIYAKRLLGGTAKLFLRSMGRVKDYPTLKKSLTEEFGPKLNSAMIHKKLAARKMKNDETYQQYFLTMKEIALHGKIEDAALIEYVIDGIRDSESNKVILYGASDMKEFRKKLDIYIEFRKKITTRPNQPTSHTSNQTSRKPSTVKRCFNCGDLDHQAPACTKGVKCFRCNDFGHKSNECPKTPKKTLKIQENEKQVTLPYKEVKIGSVDMVCLIDTGSDVNLITKSELQRIEDVVQDYEKNNVSICLTGIAGRQIHTEGVFTTKIQIDDNYADIKLHIVEDDAIPVNFIIGNPILKEFEVNFTANGVLMKKIPVFTLSIETGDSPEEYDIENSKYSKQIKKMVEDYNPNKEVKKSNVELRILLTDETPIYHSPRRLSPLETEVVNTQIKEWLEKKIIKPSKSEFASPIVLAGKKDGSHRVCIDYRGLNKKIIRERFPLPLIEDQIDRLKEAKVFTSLDLKNGFMHVDVNKSSQNLSLKRFLPANLFGVKDLIRWFLLRQKAKESIKKIQEENVRNYNNKRQEARSYEIGDLVAIKKTQFSQGSKLYPKFLGPYEIVKKNRNDRYVLKKVGNGEGPINTSSSADFMRPWISCDDSISSEADE
ncbi:hypothetical protein ABMA27_001903 [Loxostege sticticalis]|uniref:Uncharacterized protein n=1 Tax=Loxostege sticticalis TaxID=481309 RepID=A0ABR3HVU5_LOXSC